MSKGKKPRFSKGFLISISATFGLLLLLVVLHQLTGPSTPRSSAPPPNVNDLFSQPTRPLQPLAENESLKLLNQVPEAESHTKPFLEELLRVQEREGRANALIHYMKAAWVMPKDETPGGYVTSNKRAKIFSEILKAGVFKKTTQTMTLLEAWQPAFQEIRKGAALDYAKGIGNTHGPATPVPNFLTVQLSAKALCAEGLYFESEGRFAEALDDYLTALTMGRDYGSDGNYLISHLISAAVETLALDRIHKLIALGRLDRPALERSLERLKKIEQTQGTILDGFQMEGLGGRKIIEALIKNKPHAYGMLMGSNANDNIWNLVVEGGLTWSRYKKILKQRSETRKMLTNLDRALEDHVALQKITRKQMSADWWDPERIELGKQRLALIDKSHPLVKTWAGEFSSSRVRDLLASSRLRQAQLRIGLEVWKQEHESYPGALDQLTAPYFAPALPVDPFSGKSFQYQPSENGASHRLWGAGPEMGNHQGTLLYDPSNGTTSKGDIFF